MEHASDSASTSSLPDLVDADSDDSSIGIPSHEDLVVILPSHTSSLLQPLDTPTFGRWFDEQLLDRWYSHLPLRITEGERSSDDPESEHSSDDTESEHSSDDNSTSSLPDLVTLSGDEFSEDETEPVATTIFNMDEVRLDVDTYQTHTAPTRFLRPRAATISRRITVFASLSDYHAFVRERDFEQP